MLPSLILSLPSFLVVWRQKNLLIYIRMKCAEIQNWLVTGTYLLHKSSFPKSKL